SHIPVFMFFSSRHSYHLDLHSFPTRRSSDLKDTYATLHMWTQIVGKVRLALTPRLNHWWNVPLYVSARGLTTTAIPYAHFTFELRFDFLNHELVLQTNTGQVKSIPLSPRSVADFYQDFLG